MENPWVAAKWGRTPELLGFVDVSYVNASGVYALVRGQEVVYVGQTINGLRRIGHHIKDKVFDRVFFLQVEIQELREVEAWMLSLFKPKYNKAMPSEKRIAKITTARNIRQRAREGVEKLVRELKVNVGGTDFVFNHDSFQVEKPKLNRRF